MKSVVWFVCSIHTLISFERHHRNNTIGYQVGYAGYHFGVPACLGAFIYTLCIYKAGINIRAKIVNSMVLQSA